MRRGVCYCSSQDIMWTGNCHAMKCPNIYHFGSKTLSLLDCFSGESANWGLPQLTMRYILLIYYFCWMVHPFEGSWFSWRGLCFHFLNFLATEFPAPSYCRFHWRSPYQILSSTAIPTYLWYMQHAFSSTLVLKLQARLLWDLFHKKFIDRQFFSFVTWYFTFGIACVMKWKLVLANVALINSSIFFPSIPNFTDGAPRWL